MDNFHAIIPAGGAGTRLWPLSRAARPKFLLDATGTGRSLLQQTWDRLATLTRPENIHVVAGAEHADEIHRHLPELQDLIIEPQSRNTMPAFGLAAMQVEREHPGAVVGVFPADHVIDDSAAHRQSFETPVGFHETVQQCIAVAETGLLCTIGVVPRQASTALGYIQTGDVLDITQARHARAVTSFREKPDTMTAASYLDSGEWLWNAGIFIATASAVLQSLRTYHPHMYQGLLAYVEDCRSWSHLPSIAIDHAIAEPSAADGGLATVPAGFGWNDVGDFAALADAQTADTGIANDSLLWVDASGWAFNSGGRAISVLGISDAIVVDTGDNLLITTRAYAQRVKELPQQWSEKGRSDLT